METKNYSGVPKEFKPPIHSKGEPTVHQRLKYKDNQRTKVIKMAEDMMKDLCSGLTYRTDMGDMILIDSKVHDGVVFMPMIIDKKFLVDTDLLMYKITHRRINNYRETRKCITKFICPHHYKKSPQVRFADGVLYCNRCNRVLTTRYEDVSSFSEEGNTEYTTVK